MPYIDSGMGFAIWIPDPAPAPAPAPAPEPAPIPPFFPPYFPPTFVSAPPYFPPFFPPNFTPAPVLPDFKAMSAPSTKTVKVAATDIIQFNEDDVEVSLITDLLYEDIGATELANISRADLVDGQEVIYSPIANLSVIRREFNPNNLIASSALSDYFTRFGINLLSRGIYEPYFDDNGDLVIEIDTVNAGEEIQVQILSNGTISVVDKT